MPTLADTVTKPTATQTIIDRHDRFMSINYARFPVAMVRGEGVRLWDGEGREYLDMFAGFGGPVLGHCHPDLVEAIREQATKLWHVGNLFHTEPQTHLAEAIAKFGFEGKSFFCHSGADANESALKLARLYGRANEGADGARYKIISALQSFHGRSFGTMSATGQPKVSQLFEPLAPGFVHVPFNDVSAIEQAIDAQTVAVLLEPIQGEGGVILPDDDYLPAVRRLCDAHDLLLIVDEVWTGCGRTGRAFAHQHWGITPDMMTLAKGVGGGLAVGVCCASPRVAKLFDWREHGMAVHATTLGGNCLSMAVAAKIWQVLERDKLIEQASELGEYAMQRLRDAALPGVVAIRGKGLFIGIELTKPVAGEVVKTALDQGLIINAAQGNVVRLAPALVIDREQLDDGLDRVIRLLS